MAARRCSCQWRNIFIPFVANNTRVCVCVCVLGRVAGECWLSADWCQHYQLCVNCQSAAEYRYLYVCVCVLGRVAVKCWPSTDWCQHYQLCINCQSTAADRSVVLSILQHFSLVAAMYFVLRSVVRQTWFKSFIASSWWLESCITSNLTYEVTTLWHYTNRFIIIIIIRDTHTHPFNGPLSRTTRVSRYQKGKTNLDFTEARDSGWQRHQLGHMQVCTSLQTDNHASTPPLSFYRPDALPTAQRTASKHWRYIIIIRDVTLYSKLTKTLSS